MWPATHRLELVEDVKSAFLRWFPMYDCTMQHRHRTQEGLARAADSSVLGVGGQSVPVPSCLIRRSGAEPLVEAGQRTDHRFHLQGLAA